MANCTIYPNYPTGCTLSNDEPRLTGSLDREDNRRAIAMDIQRRNGIDRTTQRQQALACTSDPRQCRFTTHFQYTDRSLHGGGDAGDLILAHQPSEVDPRTGKKKLVQGEPIMKIQSRQASMPFLGTPQGDAHSTYYSVDWDRTTMRNEDLCAGHGYKCGNIEQFKQKTPKSPYPNKVVEMGSRTVYPKAPLVRSRA